ncbi:ComEC/Rec2 family competence protein [Leucobacter aridicollis]|uniref:ComEC/Rec2 family competence protein n=1 Tax=Leucobacter aridicollis TaxID=283878 RepID=UPI002169D0F6|nr:ComEC/Rec2 family competence protein [Leucobacter aridicollis]MCS3428209.1 competence protein ComEC [Leucobacter aridicollis]
MTADAGTARPASAAETGQEGASRHGQWRLLAPALGCWAVAAVLVHVPDAAWWAAVVLAALGIGLGAALISARRPHGAPGLRRYRWAGSVGIVYIASLLAVTARIATVEQGRDEVTDIVSAFGAGTNVAATVVVGGYPAPAAGVGGDNAERSWVRGRIVALAAASGGSTSAERVSLACGGHEPGSGPAPAEASPSTALAVPGPVVPVSASAILWLDGPPPERWYPGATVCLTGAIERGSPEGLSAFEISVSTVGGRGSATGVPGRLGAVAAKLRSGLRAAAGHVAGAELVPGLAVGDTSLVSSSLDRLMLESNLTHLTAVSGSNCALVIAAAVAGARALGAGRRVRVCIAGGALVGFVIIVGPDASVQRAAIMAGVLLASNFGGKEGRSLPALGLAVLVLLWADPWQAIQPGFALSVVAAGGILLAATPVTAWLRRRARIPRFIALPLAVAAVAQVSCAPLLLLLQPGFSVGGILANLLAAPAAPAGTAAGLLALLVLPVQASLGGATLALATWPARWIEAAGAVGTAIPGARLFWPEGWGGAAALTGVYCLAGLALALRGRAQRAPAPSTPGVVQRGARVAMEPRPARRRDRRGWVGPVRAAVGPTVAAWAAGATAAGIAAGVAVVAPLTLRFGVPRDWAVVACDVGQGDAVLLRDPSRRDEVILVDTGDDPDGLAACLDLFGVDRIGLLVVTHDHWDHVGALEEIGDRVDAALLPPDSGEELGRQRIHDRVTALGIRAVEAVAGLSGAGARPGAGSGREAGGLRWNVLSPPARTSYPDVNATSLVLLVEVGELAVLLLGDTGAAEQAPLMRAFPRLTADIVKVAHHGSRNQAPGFYESLGSRAALISVGAENRYGHPNPELLTTLSDAGVDVLRTDALGSIAVVGGMNGGGAPGVNGDGSGEPTFWAAGDRSRVAGAAGRSAGAGAPSRSRNARAPRAREPPHRTGARPLAGSSGALRALSTLRSRGMPRRRQRFRSRSSCR